MHLGNPQNILHPAPQLHPTGLCSATKGMQTVREFHNLVLGIPIHIHSSLAVVMPMELGRIDEDAPVTKQCFLGRMHFLRDQTASQLFDRIGNYRSNGWCTITL